MSRFSHLSVARQFLLVSFLILFVGSLVVGWWVGRQIENGVIGQTSRITSLYVDSLVVPLLEGVNERGALRDDQIEAIDNLLINTPLGDQIAAIKIWSPDGSILYSNDPVLIGQVFPLSEELSGAFDGEVRSRVSNLDKAENVTERKSYSKLIETYAPVRNDVDEPVFAVMEFYQISDGLVSEIRSAQRRSWLVVAAATLTMYAFLAGIIGRTSSLVEIQKNQLRDTVNSLVHTLQENEVLHQRVRRAAARTTSLNESFLHRASADLHDGPAQDLALALLRVEELETACQNNRGSENSGEATSSDFRTVRTALESAMSDIRSISAGLRIPDLSLVTPADTAERAIREFESKAKLEVTVEMESMPDTAPLPVKITLYRLLKEALANGFRHGGIATQTVHIRGQGTEIVVTVSDNGKGFELSTMTDSTHLGLTGLRERVEVLGGSFSLQSEPGHGTRISATLPVSSQ